MREITCDRCSAVIDIRSVDILEVTRGAMMADEREILRSADLCVNCAVELMEWLEPTPGPKPKTTRG